MVTWLQKTWIYAHPQEPDRKRPKLSESHAAISNHCAWILNHGCQWLFLCFHLSWEKMDSYIRHPSMINSMWFKLQREMFLHNLQDNLNSCPNDNTPCSALSLYTDSVKEKKLTRKQSMVRACSAPPPRGTCCCSSSSHLGIGSSSNTTTAHARVEVPEALKRQEQ